MSNPTPVPRGSSAPILVVGTLQGLLLYLIEHSREFGRWPGSNHAAYVALFSCAFFIGPLIYGLVFESRQRLAWVFVSLISAFLLASGWQFGAHVWLSGAMPVGPQQLPVPLLFLQLLLLLHAVPFLQAYLQQGRWRFGYGLLFFHAWQNVLQLALASLFTGVFCLLLALWAELFKMLGLPFVHVLIFQIPGYYWLLVAPAFGIGYLLIGSAERLLLVLRQQVLSLLKWLVPVATLIVFAFAIALAMRAPALLAEHRHVIRAVWLLWLVLVSVYLYNAAYQDGSSGEPYPLHLGRLLRFAAPLLLLLAGLAAYDLWVRIAAYGLTPSRFWATIVAAIALAYAFGYTVAGLRAGPWMAWMGRANIGVALGLIAVLALALTPVLSAERLAAKSQAARLVHSDGVAGPVDFMALRFDFGSYGYDALKRVAAEAHTPAGIRRGAEAALKVSDWDGRWKFKYTTVPQLAVELEAFPAGAVIDADLRKKILDLLPPPPVKSLGPDSDFENDPAQQIITELRKPYGRLLCSTDLPCPVLFVDLYADRQPEAIAFMNYRASVFQKGPGGWTCIGTAEWRAGPSTHGPHNGVELLAELRAGDYRLVEPRWKVLEIGENPMPMNLSDSLQRPVH